MTLKRWLKYSVALPFLAFLPVRWGYALVSRLGRWYFFRFNSDWVEHYRQGLKRVFFATPDTVIDAWVKNHFDMMAREELDVFYLKRLNEANYTDIVQFEFPNAFDANGQKHGKIIVIGHAGRTILLSALGLAGHPCGVFTMAVEGNPNLDRFLQKYLAFKMHYAMRNMKGHWITDQDDYRKIFRVLKSGESMVITADVAATRAEKEVIRPFCGGEISVSNGIARLAEKTKAQLYYGQLMEDGFRTKIRLIPLHANPNMAMDEAFELLENDIQKSPWLWWQWNNLSNIWREKTQNSVENAQENERTERTTS